MKPFALLVPVYVRNGSVAMILKEFMSKSYRMNSLGSTYIVAAFEKLPSDRLFFHSLVSVILAVTLLILDAPQSLKTFLEVI